MAPIQRTNLTEDWPKWQIALAVAAPIVVGAAGLWYYKKRKSAKTKRLSQEIKTETSKKTDLCDDSTELQVKDRLQLAQSAKNKGNKYFKAGRFDKSIECYTEALNTCPPENRDEIATFYQNRAAAYEQLKSYENVIGDCTKALDYNNRYVKALFRRAKANEFQNELTKCLEDVTAVCILESFTNQASLLMADRVLKNLGRSRAKDKYQTRQPQDPSPQFIRNYFYSFANDPIMNGLQDAGLQEETKADVLYDRKEGDEKERLEEMEKDSKSSKSHYRRALRQLRKREYSDIIRLCTAEIDSDHADYVVESLLLRATFYLLRGESNKAMDDFEKLLNMNGVDKRIRSNALIKRGSLRMQMGLQAEALDDFNLAVSLDPENSDIYHHKGQIKLLMEKFDEAAKDFAKSVTLSTSFAVAHAQKCYADYRLAVSQEDESAIQSAVKSFESTIAKFPDCAEGYALFGQVLIDLKTFDKADENFQKAIELEPDNGSIYVHRGLLRLQWRQDINEAARLIEKAMEVDSKCEFAYETLGTIEIQRGSLDKAIELFNKAINLSRTEDEMAHLYSLLDAAMAQARVAQFLGIQMPTMMEA